jgi:hypothetical protein
MSRLTELFLEARYSHHQISDQAAEEAEKALAETKLGVRAAGHMSLSERR